MLNSNIRSKSWWNYVETIVTCSGYYLQPLLLCPLPWVARPTWIISPLIWSWDSHLLTSLTQSRWLKIIELSTFSDLVTHQLTTARTGWSMASWVSLSVNSPITSMIHWFGESQICMSSQYCKLIFILFYVYACMYNWQMVFVACKMTAACSQSRPVNNSHWNMVWQRFPRKCMGSCSSRNCNASSWSGVSQP